MAVEESHRRAWLPAAPARCVIGLALIAISGPECVGECLAFVPRLLTSLGNQFGFSIPISEHPNFLWPIARSSFLWSMATLAPLPLIGAALIWHPMAARYFARLMRRLTKESPR